MTKSLALCSLAMLSLNCARIDVTPSCPESLEVGESGSVSANPTSPGAVPTYTWEVIPASAGTFANASASSTTFTATQEGDVTLQLTASDSLFVATEECTIRIGTVAPPASLSLTADPSQPEVNAQAQLTCSSDGSSRVEITQTFGVTVDLTPGSDGIFFFTPTVAGVYGFQCVTTNVSSDPANLSVVVTSTDSGRNPSRGGR